MKQSPTARVWEASSTISEAGRQAMRVEPVDVSPDQAHELAEAPRVQTQKVGQHVHFGGLVETFWLVSALGFIEAEAVEAHDRAVEQLEASLFSPRAVSGG